mgnify:CR=1 FL=1
MGSKVKVVLRSPTRADYLDYNIEVADNPLAKQWVKALGELLTGDYMLEKNYCFHGFPWTSRGIDYLTRQVNVAIGQINLPTTQQRWIDAGLKPYVIEDHFSADSVRFSQFEGRGFMEEVKATGASESLYLALSLKHEIMNRLHNHFERLQGTVEDLSPYFKHASNQTRYSIRQLNLLCHEIESLVLSQRKAHFEPHWIRPSQITTFIDAPRWSLTAEHRELFNVNKYDREFGGVYMHWCQIGKTLFEVWRDEHAPQIDKTTCEAITELQYFSGEFDIEWGQSVTEKNSPWHAVEQSDFKQWLTAQGYDANDSAGLSLGYLPLGQVNIKEAFGALDFVGSIRRLSNYLDIYKIEADGKSKTFKYSLDDDDWKSKQLETLEHSYRNV